MEYETEFNTWADAIPQPQGLYNPENEKDACGVGFVCHIKGEPRHEIVADAKGLLCNMTHRGAVGADTRDGDGAGVMVSIPHEFFKKEVKAKFDIDLPDYGRYAVGNIYLKPDDAVLRESQQKFDLIARTLGLRVLCWRDVPRKNDILGPASKSKEPRIMQPFVTISSDAQFDAKEFERKLYLLRKQSTHAITLKKWWYICSLGSKTMTYKGLLSPVQVYEYFEDLTNPEFKSFFALVHSRFSTNTFPSWDRAQPMRWCAHNG